MLYHIKVVNFLILMPSVKFLFSKEEEIERILWLYENYQWFIDHDFPICLPRFSKISHNFLINNFSSRKAKKVISNELSRIYKPKVYQKQISRIRKNWYKIESSFFQALIDLGFQPKRIYLCYVSLYGPEGQFRMPNKITIRAANPQDIKDINQTIAHEIIHLLIKQVTDKQKLSYETTEGLVDLFFKETELNKLFPIYGIQSISKIDKKLFRKILVNRVR